MERIILFVHGLGGDKSIWGGFENLIETDKELPYRSDYFVYPTPFLGIKWLYFLQKKYQSISNLSESLKTYIDVTYDPSDEVVLVGHSLGGITN